MGHIICVASQKGGTGKTTTAVNLAASLSLLEKTTLLVDCDPLGNATTGIGIDKSKLAYDLFDTLTGQASPRETLVESSLEFLQVLPARTSLHRAESVLGKGAASEQILKKMLRNLSHEFDFIIVDSPPSFGFLTKSALACADYLLLPLQYSIYAFEGLSQFLMMIRDARRHLNPSLKIAGIFYTMYRHESESDRILDTTALREFDDKLLSTVIPWDETLAKAADLAKPVALLDIMSKGAVSYMLLSQELLKIVAKDV